MVELLENIHLYNFMSTTNNENLYAIYSSDGILSGFQENNSNTFSKAGAGQTIGGGEYNKVTGNFSTIVGGYNNQIKSSDFANLMAGRNGIINNQPGAALIGDGENRNHYADVSNGLTIDFANGIYIKNSSSNLSGPAPTANNGKFGNINFNGGLVIGSYIAGDKFENIPSATNYYPATQTSITLQTNNWIKTDNYPLERTDSISYITIGAQGIRLAGVNAYSQSGNYNQSGIYSTASIDLNQNVTIETAKDGNDINLNADGNINLNANGDTILNNPYGDIKLSGTNINLRINNIPTSSSSAGTSGQISFDDNYFYRHNGKNWTRTAMSIW
jgi:hypothetical protein